MIKFWEKIKSLFVAGYDKKLMNDNTVITCRNGIYWTLDYYILKEFIVKFFILLFIFIFGFLMADVLDSFSDFLEEMKKGTANPEDAVTIWTAISYFLWRLPNAIQFILPITMLLGCIWTMATFGKNREINAMRASGISLIRCGRGMVIVGILVSCFNIYLSEVLIPITEKNATILKDKTRSNKEEAERKSLRRSFRSYDGRREWAFGVCPLGRDYEKGTLKMYRENDTLEYEFEIERAHYDKNKGWTFYGVTRTKYDNRGKHGYQSEKMKEITFSPDEIGDTPAEIYYAGLPKESLSSLIILDILARSKNMPSSTKNVYLTIFYYRLVVPWACVLAVFLGIPLATKGERSGIVLAIINAIVVVVVFMVVASIGMILGRKGILPPFIAGCGPTICFIMYGYYKLKKSQC